MDRPFEVVYESGVLRPLEPLPFAEHQRLRVMVTDGEEKDPPAAKYFNPRLKEMAWLGAHRKDYPGEYVALEGDRLLAHHKEGREVLRLAREQGVEVPLVSYCPPADEPPFGGW